MFEEMTINELEDWLEELDAMPFHFPDEAADRRAVVAELDHRYDLRVAAARRGAVAVVLH